MALVMLSLSALSSAQLCAGARSKPHIGLYHLIHQLLPCVRLSKNGLVGAYFPLVSMSKQFLSIAPVTISVFATVVINLAVRQRIPFVHATDTQCQCHSPPMRQLPVPNWPNCQA